MVGRVMRARGRAMSLLFGIEVDVDVGKLRHFMMMMMMIMELRADGDGLGFLILICTCTWHQEGKEKGEMQNEINVRRMDWWNGHVYPGGFLCLCWVGVEWACLCFLWHI